MNILDIPSAWKGLEPFAQWLVRMMRPTVIVDLGVAQGFSSCALAQPCIGSVYAIDHWEKAMQEAKAFAQ